MELTVYFDKKAVYLCDEISDELNEMMHHPDAVFVDELSTPAINSLLHEIKKEDFHAGIIWNPDLDKLKKAFFKHFVQIEAAGGIVQNEKKEILFIFRRGKWDLPKGKMEKKEKPEECAKREVEEETGVRGLVLKKKIGETYHTYDEFGKHILKTSHWFYYTCKSDQELQPQTEEDITETRWIKTRDIKQPMSNTYENIKDILGRFFDEP
jgi:ADP-ribose pyrophosphatase YjhB (NUDIX family)